MKYFILFFIFFNIYAFSDLDYIVVGLDHNQITLENCEEFETKTVFYLGYAYLFNKPLEFIGQVVSGSVLRDPIVLKSDNTFVLRIDEHKYEDNQLIYGTFKGCVNNELVFHYQVGFERTIPLNTIVFFKRRHLYYMNTNTSMELKNCDAYNDYNKHYEDRYKINYFTDNNGSYYAFGSKHEDKLFLFQEFDNYLAWSYTINFHKSELFSYKGCVNGNQLHFSASKRENKFFDLEKITFFDPLPSDTLPTYDKPSFEPMDPLDKTSNDHPLITKTLTSCKEVARDFPDYNRLLFNYKGTLYSTRGTLNYLFKKTSDDQYEVSSKQFFHFEKCEGDYLYFKSIFKVQLLMRISEIKFYVKDPLPLRHYNNPLFRRQRENPEKK